MDELELLKIKLELLKIAKSSSGSLDTTITEYKKLCEVLSIKTENLQSSFLYSKLGGSQLQQD